MPSTYNHKNKITSTNDEKLETQPIPVFQNIILFLIADALPDLKNRTSTRWLMPGGGGKDVADMMLSDPRACAAMGW